MQDTNSFLVLIFVLRKQEAHSPISLAAVQALNNDGLCHKAELPTEKLFFLVWVKHSFAEQFLIFAKHGLITVQNCLCDLLTML